MANNSHVVVQSERPITAPHILASCSVRLSANYSNSSPVSLLSLTAPMLQCPNASTTICTTGIHAGTAWCTLTCIGSWDPLEEGVKALTF
eukprot:4624941-Amphidinium_carterae.1